jgi:hypothetical protein
MFHGFNPFTPQDVVRIFDVRESLGTRPTQVKIPEISDEDDSNDFYDPSSVIVGSSLINSGNSSQATSPEKSAPPQSPLDKVGGIFAGVLSFFSLK